MFDDPKFQSTKSTKLAGPSDGAPNVEDIFAKAHATAGQAAANAGQAVGGQSAPVMPMGKAPLPAPVADKKGIFVVFSIIVIVAVLCGVAWFVYDMVTTGQSITGGTVTKEAAPAASTEGKTEEAKEDIVPAVTEQIEAEEPQNVDTDNDGLLDSEETVYGTNPNKIDSDDDGLGDKEEVKIYQTDPLNADTDGDGYSDGTEVVNGYNPNGTGKLLDFEQAKKALQGVE